MANEEKGLGGVEVREYAGDVDSYIGYINQNSDLDIQSQSAVTVDSLSAIRAEYLSPISGGVSVFLKKDGKIHNIYLNTNDEINIELFDSLVASFKFKD
jgi:hypothetical protein